MFWIWAIVGLLPLVYLCFIKPFQYWKRLQIPQYSIAEIYKNLLSALIPTTSLADFVKELYNDFPNQRYFGSYQFATATLCIRDPELIKQITIKDFDHFTDHPQFLSEEIEPIWGKNLIGLRGEKWRNMRTILSPSFTSSKLKTIYPLIINCAKQFIEFFEKRTDNIIEVELRDAFKKFGCDVIATSAFGISRNSLEDPNNDFFLMGTSIFSTSLPSNIKLVFKMIFPKIADFLNIHIIDNNVALFFENIISENIKARETKGIYRPDMIQLLVEAKRKADKKTEDENEVFKVIRDKDNKVARIQLTDEDIFSQAFLFFFAGFESVSLGTSYVIYQLAVNPEVQEKLIKEIEESIKNFGTDPPYENLMRMKYLDMVISESLRMCPITPLTDRTCTKPYTIQPKNKSENPVHLKIGDQVFFAITGLHSDPKYFPNPDRFDPERFSDENQANITSGSYMPFGSGPRSCIGNRFALMEIKLIIYYILLKFEVVVIDKTPIPLKMAKSVIKIDVEGGFWVGFKKRN